jgi:hypothetical protein
MSESCELPQKPARAPGKKHFSQPQGYNYRYSDDDRQGKKKLKSDGSQLWRERSRQQD